MSTREQLIGLGQAIMAGRMKQPEIMRDLVYSTREIHGQLVAAKVLVDDAQKQNGWKLLAKLAEYEYPGVRRGAETKSAWRGIKKPVRPLEWHHTPTAKEINAWEEKVRSHKGAGPVAGLAERLDALEARVAKLEALS